MREYLTIPHKISDIERKYIAEILAYQFDRELVDPFLENIFYIQNSINTNRIRNVLNSEMNLFLVLRAQDNLFSLTLLSGEILRRYTKPVKYRIIVPKDIGEAIMTGGNVFAKHVINIDKSLRYGDQAIVVDNDDKLIAIGKLRLSGEEIMEYKRGIALSVKERVKYENNT
ncbi:pseudouridine synthase [Candidatus Acidianus copahuensis]|uniref:Pseudouridine synthase n=1 Tax=Candidatus Acidianus copahuensis TaxID=1160895 RepID=A0A031LNC0_9CREN|nr:PUA domain-containing protein [Candidatus Acidianus copahuensis]EZQ03034.1 pseudouridine synthase [Candidatus Acidianus copahuensis]